MERVAARFLDEFGGVRRPHPNAHIGHRRLFDGERHLGAVRFHFLQHDIARFEL